MQVKVEGFQSLVRKLQKFEKKLGNGVSSGLKKGGQFLLKESLEEVPTDDGDLAKSGHVRVEGSGLDTVVIVGYSEPYAPEVHEDLEVSHGAVYNAVNAANIARGAKYFYKGRFKTYHPRRPKEQAKFLEEPTRENIDVIAGIVRHGALAGVR